MRFLHTADWHLGRIFYGTHLTEEQAYVLETQFLPLLKDEGIEAVVLAGDVFDRAVPPVEAIALWDMILSKVGGEYKIPLLVIAGNHDGPERLTLGRDLLCAQGIHIFGTPRQAEQPCILQDAWGEIAFQAFPFVEPRLLQQYCQREESRVTYDELYAAWLQRQQGKQGKVRRTVAMGHAFLTGGAASESERPLLVGGSENISAEPWQRYNYVALGHLHRPQSVGRPSMRYSGSLLKYSFDEWQQEKSFSIVDLDGAGNVDIREIPINARHDVQIIEDKFADLMDDVALQTKHKEDYLLVRLLDTVPVIDAVARLRAVYPHILALEPVGRMAKSVSGEGQVTYRHLNERELFANFAEAAWQKPLSEAEATYVDQLWQRIVEEE